ncbi:MAG: 50S ribosomal protein L15e [Candidatus Woesearchaeota archaeon]
MGFYQHIRKSWKNPDESFKKIMQERLVAWRLEPAVLRIERPTRIDKARAVGYRAKQGVFVVRVRVPRGGHMRPDRSGGRRPKKMTRRLTLRKNYQLIAEERANKAFFNCEVLNSYFVAKDGKHYWYEVILVDRSHPAIVSDKNLGWISKAQHRHRVFRGLTSAGHKVRGLRHKGKGVEKARPSRRSHFRRQ